jgi:hypothetical protein
MHCDISCPTCGRAFRVPQECLGRTTTCTGCRNMFVVGTAAPAAEAAAALPTPPAPAAIRVALAPPAAVPPPAAPAATMPPPDDPQPPVTLLPADPSSVLTVLRAGAPDFLAPVHFVLTFAQGPEEARGQWIARATGEGVELSRSGAQDINLPVGTPARHIAKNRIALALAGQEMEGRVRRSLGYPDRLARDLVDFLNGRRPALQASDYAVPIYWFLLALLPLGVGVLASLFGLGKLGVWWCLAVLPALACCWMVLRERWPVWLRLAAPLGIAGVSYAALFMTALVNFIFFPTIPASAWQPFEPPDSGCKVLMPGKPVLKTQQNSGLTIEMYAVELRRPESAFVISSHTIPDSPLQRGVTVQQRFDNSREGMLRSLPGSRLLKETTIDIQGHPGREFIVEEPGLRALVVYRVYIVGRRLIMVGAGGRGWSADHADVQKFLGSFELSAAGAAAERAGDPPPFVHDPVRPVKRPPPKPPAPIQPAVLAGPGISMDWQVVFRSHDPSMWDKDVTKDGAFGKSLAGIGNIRYLRIRNDTDYVIVKTSSERLRKAGDDGRYGWNGTNENHCAGHHLGIYDRQQPAGNDGLVPVLNNEYAGWGFGHVAWVDDRQGYCWNGRTIDPKVLEIAVKSGELTDAEKQKLLKHVVNAAPIQPAVLEGDGISRDWQVIFRSANPALWNQDVQDGPSEFAQPLSRVANDIGYLRMRKDTDYVIIPITRKQLEEIRDDGRFGWSSLQHDSGAIHLGIYDLTRPTKAGDICVRSFPWCAGWGFGHIHFRANVQGYCWEGQAISQVVFEIAVKKGPLTEAEAKKLLIHEKR